MTDQGHMMTDAQAWDACQEVVSLRADKRYEKADGIRRRIESSFGKIEIGNCYAVARPTFGIRSVDTRKPRPNEGWGHVIPESEISTNDDYSWSTTLPLIQNIAKGEDVDGSVDRLTQHGWEISIAKTWVRVWHEAYWKKYFLVRD